MGFERQLYHDNNITIMTIVLLSDQFVVVKCGSDTSITLIRKIHLFEIAVTDKLSAKHACQLYRFMNFFDFERLC